MKPPRLADQAATAVRSNAASIVAGAVVNLLTMVVLARLLDPTDFGTITIATVIVSAALIVGDVGLGNAIIHRSYTTAQLSSYYWVQIIVAILSAALLCAVAPVVAAFYREPDLTVVILAFATTLPLTAIGQQFDSLLRRDLRFPARNVVQLSGTAIYGVTTIGLALLGVGKMSIPYGFVARAAAMSLLLLFVAARAGWLPQLRLRRTDLALVARFSLFQTGERVLNHLSTNVDYLLIGRLLGSEALGYYTLAYKLMRLPLSYFNPMIVSVAFPAFARLQSDDQALRRSYEKVLRYVGMLALPVMGGLFVTAPQVVHVMYGSTWEPAVPVVQVFCLVGALKSLGNPLGSVLLARGRADLGFYINVVALIAFLLANYVGAFWGIVGVATSSLVVQLVFLIPMDLHLRWRLIGMTPRQSWTAIRSALMGAVAAMLAAMITVSVLVGASEIVQLLMVVVICGFVHLATLAVVDRATLREAWLLVRAPRLGASG